jgi:hypothetical protein
VEILLLIVGLMLAAVVLVGVGDRPSRWSR